MCVSAEKTQYGKKRKREKKDSYDSDKDVFFPKLSALFLSFSLFLTAIYTHTPGRIFFPTPKGRERALHCIALRYKIKKIDRARLILSLRMID